MYKSKALAIGMGVLAAITPAIGTSGDESNPSPAACREALQFRIPAMAMNISVPADSPAMKVAAEIQGRLRKREHVPIQGLVDSLRATYGHEMLQRASHMLMTGWVTRDAYADIASFYPVLGGELKYLNAILFSAGSDFDERARAVHAMATGMSLAEYSDTTAALAVATTLCDMAYLLRPFIARDTDSPATDSAKALYSVQRADDLHFAAIVTLSNPSLPTGLALLRRYAEWEPHPILRAAAVDVLLQASRRLPQEP